MSFGRMRNLVRRPNRPDGQFHRLKRRSRLDHPLAIGSSGARGLLDLVLFLPRKLLRGLRGR